MGIIRVDGGDVNRRQKRPTDCHKVDLRMMRKVISSGYHYHVEWRHPIQSKWRWCLFLLWGYVDYYTFFLCDHKWLSILTSPLMWHVSTFHNQGWWSSSVPLLIILIIIWVVVVVFPPFLSGGASFNHSFLSVVIFIYDWLNSFQFSELSSCVSHLFIHLLWWVSIRIFFFFPVLMCMFYLCFTISHFFPWISFW